MHELRYTGGMSTREDLEKVANCRRNLPDIQGETVARAREEGITWREIARILDVTERGVIKTQRAYEARKAAAESGSR